LTEPHDHPLEFLPELALGVLADADTAAVRAHLGGCPSCSAEFEEMRRVAALLPFAAEDVAPSPALKEGLFERISHEPRRLEPRGVVLRWPRRIAAAAVAAILFAAAGIGGFVAGGSGGSDATLRRDAARSGRLVEAAARGTLAMDHGQAGETRVSFVRAPGASEGFAWLEGMPALPPGKAYQAWFTRDLKSFEPSVVFASSGAGVWLPASGKIEGYAAMGLTIEDAAGAAAPTQAPFVTVELKTAALHR
jgi:anti-sigma factor RsiW